MSESRDAVKRIFIEWGMETGGSPHGWRCETPDVYGPCDCLEAIAAEIVDALYPIVERRKSAAWDEGYTAGRRDERREHEEARRG